MSCDTITLHVRDTAIKALVSQGCVKSLVSNGPTILQTCQGIPGPSDLKVTTKGDLLTHDDTLPLRLGVGTDGQQLTADSGAAEGISWQDPVTGALTTVGDLLGFNGATTRFPVGADDAVLVADSGQAFGYRWGALPAASLPAHAASHENGGLDEISVAGLSGLLTDAQTPVAHAPTHLPSGSDPLTTAAAGTIQPDDAAAVGVAESFARSDHQHAIVAAIAAVLVAGQVAGEGVSTSFARADHAHGIPVATPVDIVDAVNAVGVAGTFSRSDHAHAHGARAGGTLHAVATGAVAGFMSAADKTRHDAHLNPINVANPHVVTVTQAYVAGGGVLSLNTTQAELDVDGALLAAGVGGTAGPDYFTVTRGAVNILNTAYNATDLRATVYSSALNGLDIAPDPALFPDRSTIRIGMDQLQFLRQDRLIISGSPGFFLWDSELSLSAAIPVLSRSFGGFIDLGGTFQFNASASPFGMGNALLHRATWKNANAVVANLGPSFLFANNAIYQADGATITASQGRIFFDNATYNVINGGVGSMGAAIGHVSFFANLSINAGWTLALRRGMFIQNAIVAGVLTTQVAFDIEDLTTGVANIGIRSVMTAGAQKFFIEHTGSALTLLGGELEVDGTFNHDGALLGVRGLAPVALSPVYTVSNAAVRRTIDVASATLTELLEFVGTMVLDFQPQGFLG